MRVSGIFQGVSGDFGELSEKSPTSSRKIPECFQVQGVSEDLQRSEVSEKRRKEEKVGCLGKRNGSWSMQC